MIEKVKTWFKGSWAILLALLCTSIILVSYKNSSTDTVSLTTLNFSNVKVGYVADTKEAFIIDRKSNATIVILDEKLTEAIYVTKSADKDRIYSNTVNVDKATKSTK